MFKQIIFLSFLCSFAFSAEAQNECKISGIWNHSSKPAKLIFNSETAEVSVFSHDKNKSAIGSVVIKGIKSDKVKNSWNAKMYSALEKTFVDVQMESEDCNQLLVYFQGEEVLKLIR